MFLLVFINYFNLLISQIKIYNIILIYFTLKTFKIYN
jgi:hypothetical protein